MQMSLSGLAGDQNSRQWTTQFLLGSFNVVHMMVSLFPPVGWLCDVFMVGGAAGWVYGLLLASVSLAATALLVMLLGGGYQALAVRQSEAVARLNAKGKKAGKRRRARSPFQALYWLEMREIFTVPVYASNCLAPLVVWPIMLVAAWVSLGRYWQEATLLSYLVQLFPRPLYTAMAAAVIGVTCSINAAAPTAVSREGRRHDFRLSIPVAPGLQLLAKLAMGLTLNGLNILLICAVLWVVLPLFWLETVAAAAIALLYAAMLCVAAIILDAYRPVFHWKTETEAVKRNMNVMIAMLGALLALGLLAGVFYVLSRALGIAVALACAVGCIIVMDGLLLLWLCRGAAAIYCIRTGS